MLSFLYVYSDHSILECYNLFSGVELSMRSFFVISIFSILFETIFISFGIDMSINFIDFPFLSTIMMSGLLLVTCLSVWMSKSHNTLITSFSMTGKGSWLCQATEVSSRREKELAILR